MRKAPFMLAAVALLWMGLPSEASAQCVFCNVLQNCANTAVGRTSCWWNELDVCYAVGAYCGHLEARIDAPQEIRLVSADRSSALRVLDVPLVWVIRNCEGVEVRRAFNATGSAAMLEHYKTIAFAVRRQTQRSSDVLRSPDFRMN